MKERAMTDTTHDDPRLHRSDELRARIPGWGVDIDPADRPSVPKEVVELDVIGPEGETPARQPELVPRERSIEHASLTPVFGTTVPPKGLSGVIRRVAYRRYSEARAAHWLLLIAADRVDAWESHLASFASARPDQPITETGIRSEVRYHGLRSRIGQGRADLAHQAVDPVIVVGPWIAVAWLTFAGVRALARRRRRG
jgi:hypothetical protein